MDFLMAMAAERVERAYALRKMDALRAWQCASTSCCPSAGRRGLDAVLLSEVNRQLQDRGLKVRHAPVAVVDATIVARAANRACLTEAGIMFRTARHRRRFNQLASRSRFMGRQAVETEMALKATVLNLLKVASQTELAAA